MGTAAFVALLMALCNSSFSATQFALLSALSAVGRVYVGPAAGWLVELWGWPGFYAFSVIAGIPGLVLLFITRHSLVPAVTGQFTQRHHFSYAYRWAFRVFLVGCLVLFSWLATLTLGAMHWLPESFRDAPLFEAGMVILVCAVLFGVFLDCLSLKKDI